MQVLEVVAACHFASGMQASNLKLMTKGKLFSRFLLACQPLLLCLSNVRPSTMIARALTQVLRTIGAALSDWHMPHMA